MVWGNFKIDHKNIWIVSKVISDHNHPLIGSNKAYILIRWHGKILLIYIMVIDPMIKDGIHKLAIFLQKNMKRLKM